MIICIVRNIERRLFFVDSSDPVAVLYAAINEWYGISLDPKGTEVLRDFASAYSDLPYMELEIVNLGGEPIRNPRGGIIPPFHLRMIKSPEFIYQLKSSGAINSISQIDKGVDHKHVEHLWFNECGEQITKKEN
jgi:hypothetical protein